MKKLKVVQVSGNSRFATNSGDRSANSLLRRAGFVSREDGYDDCTLYIGCVPGAGKTFFVYYEEPATKSNRGSFRLVRIENDQEIAIDEGSASESHVHGGLGTLTFYGRGNDLASWSFHCEQEPVCVGH